MSKPPTSSAGATWAEVRARDRVMRYRRSGRGPTVVLLAFEEPKGLEELVAGLAAHFRLLVPEMPSADAGVAGWLVEFLEGLGMQAVSVVAVGRLCISALELALRDRDQVGRVVLITDGGSCENVSEGALATASRHATMPLLIVRSGAAMTDTVPPIADFLSDVRGSQTG